MVAVQLVQLVQVLTLCLCANDRLDGERVKETARTRTKSLFKVLSETFIVIAAWLYSLAAAILNAGPVFGEEKCVLLKQPCNGTNMCNNEDGCQKQDTRFNPAYWDMINEHRTPSHQVNDEHIQSSQRPVYESEVEVLSVVQTHTIIDPETMMVHLQDAAIAASAMVGPQWLHNLTCFAVPSVLWVCIFIWFLLGSH